MKDFASGGFVDTLFLHAGDMEIAEYTRTSDTAPWTLARRYVPGLGVDDRVAMIDVASGAEEYFQADRLGNVIAMVDEVGDVIAQYLYTPFGVEEPLNASGNPFRYTGRRLDAETGLYYYRARYYDPETGRFLQTDPIGYEDQMNLYAYVGNDPLNKTAWRWVAICRSTPKTIADIGECRLGEPSYSHLRPHADLADLRLNVANRLDSAPLRSGRQRGTVSINPAFFKHSVRISNPAGLRVPGLTLAHAGAAKLCSLSARPLIVL